MAPVGTKARGTNEGESLRDKILYDDDDLTVEARFYDSPVVFFTFSEMIHKPENGAWAREVLRKLGVSYVGFIAKRPNWFPAPSMRRARAAIAPFQPRERIAVGYGHSQGGYATIRYANLLGLDHALSFCPQFSIDPEDTRGFDPRYHAYFPGSAEHRAIRPEDVSDKTQVHLIYDPWFDLDKGHADRIVEAVPSAQCYRSYATGHNTIRMLASSRAMTTLVETLSKDAVGLGALLIQLRRAWPLRRDILAQYASNRHPELCMALLDRLEAPLFLPECVGPDGVARNLLSHGLCREVVARQAQFGDGPFERRSVVQALLALGDLREAKRMLHADADALDALKEVDEEFATMAESQFAGDLQADPNQSEITYGNGWHGQEEWGRWGSALAGHMTVTPDDDGEQRLQMIVSCFQPERQAISIRIEHGGKSIVFEQLRPGPFSLRFSGKLHMEICVDRLLSPFSLGQAGDKRLLGASIAELRLEPIVE